jgi:hypothetical protein
MHITQFLFGDPGIDRFIAALEERFQWVTPIRRPADDAIVAVAFTVKDLGDLGAELYDMPEAEETLAGILDQDVEIVSAWEGYQQGREPQRVWNIKGRRTLANEKTSVVDRGEMPPPSSGEIEVIADAGPAIWAAKHGGPR